MNKVTVKHELIKSKPTLLRLFLQEIRRFYHPGGEKSSAELSDLNTSCSGFQLQTSFKGKLHQFYTLKCVYGLGSLTLYVKTVA